MLGSFDYVESGRCVWCEREQEGIVKVEFKRSFLPAGSTLCWKCFQHCTRVHAQGSEAVQGGGKKPTTPGAA